MLILAWQTISFGEGWPFLVACACGGHPQPHEDMLNVRP